MDIDRLKKLSGLNESIEEPAQEEVQEEEQEVSESFGGAVWKADEALKIAAKETFEAYRLSGMRNHGVEEVEKINRIRSDVQSILGKDFFDD